MSVLLETRRLSVDLSARAVLHGIDLALPRAHFAALVGPNGAGKTTLLRALAGLIGARGEVIVEERPLASLDHRGRAKTFGYLPQGHLVHWPLPVRDVVALGRFPHGAVDPARLAESDHEIVARAMAAADVTALADRRATELSGGERARVALARVIAVEAPIILADEPTASLDPRHQIDVMSVLRQSADRGTLVVAVTHDLGLAARFADSVLVIHEGRLVAAAPPLEALNTARLAKVFRVDAFQATHRGQAVLVPWTGA